MGNFTPHFNLSSFKSLALATVAAMTMAVPTADARTISAEEALQRVMNQNQSKVLDFKVCPRLVYTMPMGATQTPGLYVFANSDNHGFIILSAEDQARALLGYSDHGVFDEQNIPAPLAYWLECYADEIASLQQNTQLPNRVLAPENKPNVAPLLTTRWTQTAPYNNQCPQINGYSTVTGCTATALGQVMKYFNYPDKGTGSNIYEWNGEFLSSDFAAHTYDWSNMLDTYTGDYNTAEEEAISQLMRDCAIAINTNFGIGDSSAYTRNAFTAFSNNFGYDRQVRYMERKYYTLSDWEEAIYDQLKNHGPVLYAGVSANGGGHAFVCDGYSDGYFHINWGWAGMSDGYFSLSALNPEQQGVGGGTSGYNSGQNIITNIFPNQGGKDWIEIVSTFDFNIKETSANVGKVINFSVGLYNLSAIDVTPVVGLAFTNTSNNETTYTTGSDIGYNLPASKYFTTPVSVRQNIPADLKNGTYIVRPAYQDLSGDWHILNVDMSLVRSYEMTVSGNTATFSADEPPMPTVTASALLTPLYGYNAFKASVTLKNPTKREFYGLVYPCFLQNGYIVHTAAELSVTLDPQEIKTIEYIGTCDIPGGQYQMCFCVPSPTDANSMLIISNRTDVTVQEAKLAIPAVTNLRFADDNSDEVVASDLTLIFDVTVEDGIFQNPLYLGLFPGNGGYSINMFMSEPMFFNQGLNPNVTLTTDISGYVEIGNSYLLGLYINQAGSPVKISDIYPFTVGSLNGVTSIVADEDVLSSTYFTLQGIQLKTEPTETGVYIKVDNLRSGTSRTSKVMVR